MSLTETQIAILREIKNNFRATVEIARNLGIERSTVNYLLKELEKQEYIRGTESFPPDSVGKKEYMSTMLTDKGETAVASPEYLIQEKAQATNSITLTVDSINAPISFMQGTGTGNNAQVNQTSTVSQEITEIIEKIEKLERGLVDFPEDVREEASVHLENLKSELESSSNPQPKRIRSCFKATIRVLLAGLAVSPVVITDGTDFLNNITDLAEKFDVEISSGQVKEFQRHFDSLSPLTAPEITPSQSPKNDD